MSRLPPEELLRHILDEAEYLLGVRQQLDRDAFLGSETYKRACVRSLEVIGEATKRLDEAFRAQHPEVQWRDMARARDRLIHGYEGVDYSIVWDIVETEIPKVETQIRAILHG